MNKRLVSFVALLLLLTLTTGIALADAPFRPWNKQESYQYVTFGTYPMTADGEVQPMRWIVLDTFENGTAFLLTELVIDGYPVIYETDKKVIKQRKYRHVTTFEESDLYAWMNSEMLNTLFTAEEQAMLDDSRGKLFLPTNEEYIDRYGWPRSIKDTSSRDRMCDATPYALARGVYHGPYKGAYGATFWCNRMRGWRYMQIVGFDGHESWAGVTRMDVGVRPAILVRISDVEFASGSGAKDDPYVLVPVSAE